MYSNMSKSYFYKVNSSNVGLVVTDKQLGEVTTITKNIGGKDITIRQQSTVDDVKFGFLAISQEDGMHFRAQAQAGKLKVGAELPLEFTDKKVKLQDGSLAENLYWVQ